LEILFKFFFYRECDSEKNIKVGPHLSYEGKQTYRARHTLAPYPWSGSVSWCLAEGYGNGDQRRPMSHMAREGLYFTLLLHLRELCVPGFFKTV